MNRVSDLLKATYERACVETTEKHRAGIWSDTRRRERDAYEEGLWQAYKIALAHEEGSN
jgi:hypothetical protein